MRIKMRKTCFILVSVLFLVLFLNYDRLIYLFADSVLTVNVLSEEKIENMIADKKIAEMGWQLTCDGNPVVYDEESKTIYIPQNMGKKEWEGRLSAAEGRLYFKSDEYLDKKEDAISTGHSFEAYLIKDDNYSVCSVVFTGMPIMNLSVESSALEDEIMINSGTVQIYDPYHASARFQSAECTFHIRGGSSWNYPKSNYKLELKDTKLSFLGMRQDEDWILNSLYDDAGLIHNKISYQVWREIAGHNNVKNDEGTTLEFVEVFIDNEYCGVYALTERIDAKELSLGKKDILYKCRADRIPEEHNYSNEDTDDMRPIFILKYPQDYEEEDWEPLKAWVDDFLKEEAVDYEESTALLDMENSIDYNLFCLLIGGMDNRRKNVFFIAEYQDDGTYCFKKVPWDLNATWGNPWVDMDECNFTLYHPEYYQEVSAWATDVSTLYYYDEVEISSLLYERWQELRKEGIITKEKIYEMLDEQFTYLHESGAYQRNYRRWPKAKEYWQDDYIYEYAEKRISFLDEYFEQLYLGNISSAIYEDVDYSEEFEARYYWETNYETLSELYSYDRQILLEHYVLYGKPFGLIARKPIEGAAVKEE